MCKNNFHDEYRRMGLKVAYYRKLRLLTQEALANRAGISASYLSRIERGDYKRGPSFRNLLSLARELGVDVAELARNGDI